MLVNMKSIFNWWLQGISLLLPARLREILTPDSDILGFEVGENETSVTRYAAGQSPQTNPETRRFAHDDDLERDAVLGWYFNLKNKHHEFYKEEEKKAILLGFIIN